MPQPPTDALARAAIEDVRAGMVVGLGTGRAAARAIAELARRAAEEKLDLRCVATSRASARQAEDLGLRVVPLESVVRVDHLFDGADEVDPALRMIKGKGGAMTLEKLVARAASRRVYLVQEAKLVGVLGETAPLPVEVEPEEIDLVVSTLGKLGLEPAVRRGDADAPVLTDAGNPIVDAALPRGSHAVDLDALGAALDLMPGVVGHGLFLGEADLVLVEDAEGQVTRRARPGRTAGP
jgi:ribose 5-phosphate isomerase A